MRLLVIFLLVTAALVGLRGRWGQAHDPDPWARAARRMRPLLLEIEDELRKAGKDTDADRIAACTETVRAWEAPR